VTDIHMETDTQTHDDSNTSASIASRGNKSWLTPTDRATLC